VLGGNLSPEFSAILKLAGVEGGLENNLFRGKARVFEGEQRLLAALDKTPERFQNHDMIIVRYEGPSGAPGMPEMLDPTSRITMLCRERGITVALMTDARFSGGSVGLVIGHVGPEAALGGPIALIEDGDEIVADLNTNELNCTALQNPATFKARRAAWDKVVASNGGTHPNSGSADTRLLHRARHTAVPATRGGGLHPNREVWVRDARVAEKSGFNPTNTSKPAVPMKGEV
jgi:dihydroxy-acid dehydratase